MMCRRASLRAAALLAINASRSFRCCSSSPTICNFFSSGNGCPRCRFIVTSNCCAHATDEHRSSFQRIGPRSTTTASAPLTLHRHRRRGRIDERRSERSAVPTTTTTTTTPTRTSTQDRSSSTRRTTTIDGDDDDDHTTTTTTVTCATRRAAAATAAATIGWRRRRRRHDSGLQLHDYVRWRPPLNKGKSSVRTFYHLAIALFVAVAESAIGV
jgi:hypothetical protein